MDGELALAIALTNHGNAFLSDPMSAAIELSDRNSAFRYLESIAFAERKSKRSFVALERQVAKEAIGQFGSTTGTGPTAAWFLMLRRRKATHLELNKVSLKSDLPERFRAAFSGGQQWAVQSSYHKALEVWLPKWTHTGGAKPWRVRVEGEFLRAPLAPWWPALEHARVALEKSVRKAAEFCERVDEDWFAQRFRESLVLLESEKPDPPYYPDIVTDRFPQRVGRRVLAAGARAWLFGGMGSFNDLGFEDQATRQEYEDLADELWGSVMNAIFSSVNTRPE
jgi:hypothetical protein